ncbi:MAG: exonuclease subunit SbcD, partial [Epulopiscium sp.]|nr:exonuclease subunit SbcD [Candidatus Epulonipiscium sp.]
MRILHTGDWHLGKNLEGYERLQEQEQFIDELVTIVEEQQVQMVIVSGDIYDHSNPPAKAERIFYEALKRLNHKGERLVVVIAGNHDNPERLTASVPLLYEEGIFLLGTFHDVIPAGTYPTFTLHQSGKGYMEIEFQGERVLLLTLPYPSEKRLNEIFAEELQEEVQQKAYSNRIGEVLQELASYYREDTINLCISHLYLRGGAVTDSERPIQLGGSLAVHIDEFPKEAQYIALGHLH